MKPRAGPGSAMKPRDARALVHRIERAMSDALSKLEPAPSRPTKLLVAVSGGADSSATLFALAERAERHGWQIHAAHVDHGIADSETRASFRAAVRDLTGRLKIPFTECAVDVPSVAATQRLSVETAARQERYAALTKVAAQLEVAAIVTGHTADDQAESVLLHLLRGSGLDGLAGMSSLGAVPIGAPREDTVRPSLIRPLLAVRRAQTRALCAHHSLAFADDPANQDSAFTRNRIRAQVLPALETLNPNAVGALVQLAANVRPDRKLLEELTLQAFAKVSLPSHQREVLLSRAALAALPEALRIRVLRMAVLQFADSPSHDRSQALLRLARSGGHTIECGGGVQAEARGDRLRIWGVAPLPDGGAAYRGPHFPGRGD